jgi:hypothetical protein
LLKRLCRLESNATTGTSGSYLDTPPVRDQRHRFFKVPLSDDKRCPVQHRTIDRNLARQAVKVVGVALDLVAVQVAVHHGDIDAAGAVPQAQLVQHKGIGVAMVLSKHLAMQSLPDVSIAHA